MSGEEPGLGLDGLTWFKSTYSAGNGGECVEIATHPGGVHVRDSKDTTRTALAVHPAAWNTFLQFATV
ncbi:DUF397 domain-containing protein [Streptomyces griseoviridis]|uniref:DUF397 domain-containing protein n=1 Tax=Streptomyces hintoniae TaxID=3075521 RepID=A0ABU2UDJ4_9ACTN|nr:MULTISPECIES: DUF397 domain-containing protein [unclassified Streptomyces]MDH6697985.1 hypothetical protein [Streptomyces sp. MAA16]MDT0471317.1 DUF397 domain-containing protein [Streptomyces sp. DSM 41014]